MIKYRLTESGVIDRETNASIPDASGNCDWQEYQEWLTAGNIPIPLSPFPYYDLVDDIWVIDMVRAKENGVTDLYARYYQKLHGGYTSSVLGTAHIYATAEEARNDLFAALGLGVDRKFFCLEAATSGKVNPLHTSVQLRQIADAFASAKEDLIELFYLHKANILAAVDEATLATAIATGLSELDAVITV